MRVTVTRKEETNYIIEHQNDPFHGLDLIEMEAFISFLHKDLTRPECCERCTDEHDDFEKGECPCQAAMSSL